MRARARRAAEELQHLCLLRFHHIVLIPMVRRHVLAPLLLLRAARSQVQNVARRDNAATPFKVMVHALGSRVRRIHRTDRSDRLLFMRVQRRAESLLLLCVELLCRHSRSPLNRQHRILLRAIDFLHLALGRHVASGGVLIALIIHQGSRFPYFGIALIRQRLLIPSKFIDSRILGRPSIRLYWPRLHNLPCLRH